MDSQQPGLVKRYFAGLAEHTFQARLGVADPPLIDYVADLLVRFVRSDRLYRIRNLTGRPLTELVEMLLEAEQRIGEARREVHRHIGDFALFWTGVYPEALAALQGGGKKDHLVDYCQQGKRSYWIASTIASVEDDLASGPLLQRLSEEFELCAYGLREVRRQWEERGEGEIPPPLVWN
jgi:hypothetical protein